MKKDESVSQKVGHKTTEFYLTVAYLAASLLVHVEWPVLVSGSAVLCMYLYSRTKVKTPPPVVPVADPVKTDVGAILPNAKSVTIQR